MSDHLSTQLQDALGAGYLIERELGGGGMSHVFLAHDTSLSRHVVVKVLPPDAAAALSGDRFRREIALAARLQHPHIVPLLGAGQTADGLPYYTMPFVEGESLRERLARTGELPVGEAVGMLREVARALAYAHEHGIIHRDIKPDNVMLSGGAALVLDFGVAKAVTASASAPAGTTITQLGMALGTPAYMSPEQAVADPGVDHRADIYSFGCLAYEALTGSPPFSGRNTSAMLAAQVTDAPEDIRRRRPSIPAPLAALVMQCLEKRAADRPQHASDLLRALDAVPLEPSSVSMGAADRARASSRGALARRWAPWAIAAGALAVAAAMRSRSADPTPGRTVRFVVPGVIDLAVNGAPAITPDGANLVFVDSREGGHPLFVRPMSELRARRLAGTEEAIAPFVSPDGRWVAFFTTNNKLRKVPIEGGSIVTIADASSLGRASWGRDAIVVGGQEGEGLSVVPAEGGVPRRISAVDTMLETGHSSPLALADGKTVFFATRDRGDGEVAVVTYDARSPGVTRHTRLGIKGTPIGMWRDWLLVRSPVSALVAARFDASGPRLVGAPVTIADESVEGIEPVSLARDGTLLSTRRLASDSAVLVDEHGVGRSLLGALPQVFGTGNRGYMTPRISPDGRRLALMAARNGSYDVVTYDLATQTRSRITDLGLVYGSEWTPDGRGILFSTNASAASRIGNGVWIQAVDGSEEAHRVLTTAGPLWATMTPDGRTLVYQRQVRENWEIWARDLTGADTAPRPLVREQTNAYMPHVSPDGHWLAYVSSAEDREDVYVRPYPARGVPVRVSEHGGNEPMWSPDGRRLFYRNGRDFIAASVRTEPAFAVDARTVLFRATFDGGMPHANYAVLPDGRHFIFLAASAQQSPDAVVTVNWVGELRKRLDEARAR